MPSSSPVASGLVHAAGRDFPSCVLDAGCALLAVVVVGCQGGRDGEQESGLVEVRTLEVLRVGAHPIDPVFAVPFSRRAGVPTRAHAPNAWDDLALAPRDRLLLGATPTTSPLLAVARAVGPLERSEETNALLRCIDLETLRARAALAPERLVAALADPSPLVGEWARRVLREHFSREAAIGLLARAARGQPPGPAQPALAAALAGAPCFQPDLWADAGNVAVASALAHGLAKAAGPFRGEWLRWLEAVLGAPFSPDAAESVRVRGALLVQLEDPTPGDLRALLEEIARERSGDSERARALLDRLGSAS